MFPRSGKHSESLILLQSVSISLDFIDEGDSESEVIEDTILSRSIKDEAAGL